jgi:hypothetical protein
MHIFQNIRLAILNILLEVFVRRKLFKFPSLLTKTKTVSFTLI